jgi:hypothetical protein
MNILITSYLLMMLLQTWHILEEIGCGAYKVAHTLTKYLFAASVLVTINYVGFALILNGSKTGYIIGLFTSAVLAVGNGIVHIVGYIKTKTLRDSLGAGFYTGIPLAIVGGFVFYQLINILLGG